MKSPSIPLAQVKPFRNSRSLIRSCRFMGARDRPQTLERAGLYSHSQQLVKGSIAVLWRIIRRRKAVFRRSKAVFRINSAWQKYRHSILLTGGVLTKANEVRLVVTLISWSCKRDNFCINAHLCVRKTKYQAEILFMGRMLDLSLDSPPYCLLTSPAVFSVSFHKLCICCMYFIVDTVLYISSTEPTTGFTCMWC